MQQKIVITGGPGTGKSTVIDQLAKLNYTCMHEISRDITLEAKKKGVEQLFLKKPNLFSELLLKGREKQYLLAQQNKSEVIFFDRGIPDIHAYMNYLGVEYEDIYHEKSMTYRYSHIFMMPPWQNIYLNDNERYESFEQSLAIYNHLEKTYKNLGYSIIEVPTGDIQKRVNFILDTIDK